MYETNKCSLLVKFIIEQNLTSNAVQIILVSTHRPMHVQVNIPPVLHQMLPQVEVVRNFSFISEYNGERIIKIGPHLSKLS